MHGNLTKNSQIFAVNFAVENFEFFIMIALALKFTQKGDQS